MASIIETKTPKGKVLIVGDRYTFSGTANSYQIVAIISPNTVRVLDEKNGVNRVFKTKQFDEGLVKI